MNSILFFQIYDEAKTGKRWWSEYGTLKKAERFHHDLY